MKLSKFFPNIKTMKPTILFVLHLPPPVHGAAMVGKYIHDSSVVNERFDCRYINLATAKDLADIGKVGIRKFVQFISLLRRIRKMVKEARPSLVYVTPNACGVAFYKDFIVVELLKRMGRRVVVHYHNKGVSTRQGRGFDNFLYKRFFRGLEVILLSEKLYPDVCKYVDKEDVYFCPNGIPDVEYCGSGRNNVIPRLLYLSNLQEEKGALVLLDALKLLKDKGLEFACDVVGGETAEISNERFEAEISKRGLDGVVAYHGKKYGKDKDDFFNQSDIFVFPTYYHNECFPVVLLEAMQHGLPCVSTDEGGIADIIDEGKTGYVVKRKDAVDLAKGLDLLMDNPDLRVEMGRQGRLKYERSFTYGRFERRITGILSGILKKRD